MLFFPLLLLFSFTKTIKCCCAENNLCSHAYFVKFASTFPKFWPWTHMRPLHALMSITGQKTQAKSPKLHFSTGWPWPLTYDLDHKTIRQVIKVNPYSKFCDRMSVGSTVRAFTNWHRQTDKPIDGSIFITSTADAGGKMPMLIDVSFYWMLIAGKMKEATVNNCFSTLLFGATLTSL